MRYAFLHLFVAAVVAIAAPSTAEAGMPLPCFSEKVVKVADLPGVHAPNGTKVDLGYLFSGCSGSQWVGTAGSRRGYYDMKPGAMEELVASGKLPAQPTPPGFWYAALTNPVMFWVEWVWIIVTGFVVVGSTLASIAQRLGTQSGEPVSGGSPAGSAATTRSTHIRSPRTAFGQK